MGAPRQIPPLERTRAFGMTQCLKTSLVVGRWSLASESIHPDPLRPGAVASVGLAHERVGLPAEGTRVFVRFRVNS
jgi:hypothetical protein